MSDHADHRASVVDLRRARPSVDPVGVRAARETLLRELAGAGAKRVKIGRFSVLDKLGQGAHGVVYSAYDPKLDRRVALKLLRHNAADTRGLLKEARAMAKLAHPNVITVYDTGESEGDAYVAMEYVDGGNLGDWLQAGSRSVAEILSVLLAAGEGLAHAHAHGLVHRDFKPGNVIVGHDGRVCVADFGLAHVGKPVETGDDDEHEPSGDANASTLGMAGTPAYMAPEQHEGRGVDHRTDQYSFCVAAWEALTGRHPFGGGSIDGLLEAKREGPGDWPGVDGADGALRSAQVQALVRGMAHGPDARWGSMHALLAQLRPERPRRRWWIPTGLAVGVLGMLAGGVVLQRSRSRTQRVEACVAAGSAIDDAWGVDARRGLKEGFVATGLAYAGVTADAVGSRIDQHVEAWRQGRTLACMNATVSGAWDRDTSARAQWCLEGRRLELASLLAAFRQPDATVVQNAVGAAAKLPAISPCLDEAALDNLDAPAEAQWTALAPARATLAKARTLRASGQTDRALSSAREAAEQAHELGWVGLAAAAGALEGELLDQRGDYPGAEEASTTAYLTAFEAGAWTVAASAAASLVATVGDRQARHAEGQLWAKLSAAASARGGDPLGLTGLARAKALGQLHRSMGDAAQAKLYFEEALAIGRAVFPPRHPEIAAGLNELALAEHDAGDDDAALRHLRQALRLRQEALSPEHPDVATSHGNLAGALKARGEYADARDHYRRALEIREAELGPDHPQVATVVHNLGALHEALGEAGIARAHYERALASRERSLGKDHPLVATTLHNLAVLEYNRDDFDAALPHAVRAVDITERALGPDHPQLVGVLDGLAAIHKARGDAKRGRALRRRAADVAERALGPDHPRLVSVLSNLAGDHAALGEHEQAIALQRRALAITERGLGKSHPRLAAMLANLATDHLALQQYDAAVALLERARTICNEHQCHPLDDGPVRFGLAKAIVQSGGDPDRARALALEARALADGGESRRAGEVTAIDAWLSSQGWDDQKP